MVNNAATLGVTTEVGDEADQKEALAGKDANEVVEWLRQRTTQSIQEAEDCLKINYHGTKNVTEALLPLLQSSPDGRIVNVTSGIWATQDGGAVRQELRSIDTLTKERLEELPAQLPEGRTTRAASWGPAGGPRTRCTRRTRENAALRVNCVHPGYVQTEMNCHTGSLTPAEDGDVGVTGAYFDRTEVASFE
ncbi:hypothetical protein ACP4OV_000697 [Aristida adscensionis]